MEAFLLAAGLGTRLRPLTDNKPKALVEVDGRTLLEINILNLIRQGASRIVVNVHHFGDQIIDFIASRHWDAEILISDERDLLMDTGGGLKKAAPLFSGSCPIVVHNVDILSQVNVSDLVAYSVESKALATLAVSQRSTSRMLLFNDYGALCGWHNRSTDEFLWPSGPVAECKEFAFSGIAVVSPQLLEALPEPSAPYPIVPAYLELSKIYTINSFVHDSAHWLDVGKPDTLARASQFVNL